MTNKQIADWHIDMLSFNKSIGRVDYAPQLVTFQKKR